MFGNWTLATEERQNTIGVVLKILFPNGDVNYHWKTNKYIHCF